MIKNTPLRVAAEEANDGVFVFRIGGDLFGNGDGYSLQNAVRTIASRRPRAVVLDLAGIEHIDSCGFGILVACFVSVSNGGGRFGLTAAPPRVESLLSAMRVLDLMVHTPSLDEALRLLRVVDH